MSSIHKSIVNMWSKRLRDELATFRSESWTDALLSLSTEDGTLWRKSRALKRRNRDPSNVPIHGRNGLVYSDTDKAESCADYLERVFGGFEGNPDESIDETVEDYLTDLPTLQGMDIAPATLSEIKEVISKQKNKRVPGPARISMVSVKHLPDECLFALTNIINSILTLGYFPSAWKKAEVVMIAKPGKDPVFPSSYRPISLLSHVSKISEAVILSRLREQVIDLGLIQNEKFGFRFSHSADLQLFRFTQHIRQAWERGEVLSAVCLDIASAFDSVWHDELIHKLAQFGINPHLVRLLKSYLSERSFHVRSGEEHSTIRPILAGIPQGSLLGPELFLLFMSDLPRAQAVSLAIFADDTAVFASSKNENILLRALQRSIDSLTEWFDKWHLRLNEDKCVAVRYSFKRIPPPDNIYVGNTRLPWSSEARYLGVTVDAKLTFKNHVNNVKSKYFMARNTLIPLVHRNSSMDLSNKLLIFKIFLRPILTYVALSWCTVARTNLNILETLQSKYLRMITGSSWFVRNAQIRRDLSIPSFSEHLLDLSNSARNRAELSENPLILELVEPQDRPPPRRIVRNPLSVLDAAGY